MRRRYSPILHQGWRGSSLSVSRLSYNKSNRTLMLLCHNHNFKWLPLHHRHQLTWYIDPRQSVQLFPDHLLPKRHLLARQQPSKLCVPRPQITIPQLNSLKAKFQAHQTLKTLSCNKIPRESMRISQNTSKMIKTWWMTMSLILKQNIKGARIVRATQSYKLYSKGSFPWSSYVTVKLSCN